MSLDLGKLNAGIVARQIGQRKIFTMLKRDVRFKRTPVVHKGITRTLAVESVLLAPNLGGNHRSRCQSGY